MSMGLEKGLGAASRQATYLIITRASVGLEKGLCAASRQATHLIITRASVGLEKDLCAACVKRTYLSASSSARRTSKAKPPREASHALPTISNCPWGGRCTGGEAQGERPRGRGPGGEAQGGWVKRRIGGMAQGADHALIFQFGHNVVFEGGLVDLLPKFLGQDAEG